MIPPTSIDGTDITGATIDGTDVQEITVDGDVVFSAGPSNLPVAYSNLVAWYPFDSAEYGGSNADDVTAIIGGSGDDTAYDGTVSGASYQSTGGVTDINAGANSGAFDFVTSDHITTNLDINVENSFSICFYVNLGSVSDNHGLVYAQEPPGDYFYVLHYDPRNQIELIVGSIAVLTIKSNPTANDWYHCTLTHNGTTTKTYLDGGTTPVSTSNISLTDENYNFEIGDDNGDGSAKIDDVRIYNKELTGTEISQIYQNTEP